MKLKLSGHRRYKMTFQFILTCSLLSFGSSAVTVPTDGGGTSVKVSSYAVDVSGRPSVTFKLKTCDATMIQIFPKDKALSMTGFKIQLNRRTENGAIYATSRLCQVKSNGNLACDSGDHKPMRSTCQEHKAFWVRFTESGKSEFGHGCEVGSGTMFSHTEANPFILGEISLSSTQDADWIFEDDSCDEDDPEDASDGGLTEEPTHISTNEDGTSKGKEDINKYGLDFSGKDLVKFQLKTCQQALIRFFPRSLTTYSTGYKITLNLKDESTEDYTSIGHQCYVTENDHLECYNETSSAMTATCQQYQTFWFRVSEGRKVELGVGCEEGVDRLYSHSDTLPFVLGKIAVSSDARADWMFGSTVCKDQDTADATKTDADGTATEEEESDSEQGTGESDGSLQDEDDTSSKSTNNNMDDAGEDDASVKDGEDLTGSADSFTSEKDGAETNKPLQDKEDSGEASNGDTLGDGGNPSMSIDDGASTGADEGRSSEADVNNGNEAAQNTQSDVQAGTGVDGDGTQVEKEDKKLSLSSILDEYLDNGSSSLRLPHIGLLICLFCMMC